MLVTRNIVDRQRRSGINWSACSSTVTHNTSNENALDGIVVGQKSLVTYNTANDNGGDGIQAVCPATVTNNKASDNGDLDSTHHRRRAASTRTTTRRRHAPASALDRLRRAFGESSRLLSPRRPRRPRR